MFEIYFDDLTIETQERLLKGAEDRDEAEEQLVTDHIPIGHVSLPDFLEA